jgi:hypothetical protein
MIFHTDIWSADFTEFKASSDFGANGVFEA